MPLEKSAGAIIFHQPHNRTPKENKFPTGQTSSLWGKNKETEYLLLHYPSSAKAKKPRSRDPEYQSKARYGARTSLRGRDYWDLPKGHIEKDEGETTTVIREIEEETGLKDVKLIEGFKELIKYFFKSEGKTIFKTVVFYLAETKTKEVKISFEHIGYKWLPYEEAIQRLTFDNAKGILRKAHRFLGDKNKR